MRKRSGFTLIELLVVIAIIALLMSILMPALARVKKQAKLVMDLANLRQWGLIYHMFLEDTNGRLTNEGLSWYRPLWRYYKAEDLIKGCPAAEKPVMDAEPTDDGILGRKFAAWSSWVDPQDWEEGDPPPNRAYAGSYGLNYWFTQDTGNVRDEDELWGFAPGSLLAARGQDRVPMLLDCLAGGNCPLPTDIPPAFDGDYYAGGTNRQEIRNFCINRHDGYVNGVFLDGNARKIGLKELWLLRWHRKWMEDLEIAGWPTAWDVPDHWMYKFKDYNPFR